MMTIDEVHERLQTFVPSVSLLTGSNTTLERIRPLMELIGNPQNKIPAIHIAGTSGKTSTAYFMSALLTASGKRVGLTVSPHIDSVTERIQIDTIPISEAQFSTYLEKFLDIIEQLTDKPSYFELLYALSFYVFEKEQVDYVVIETGMGGSHDATNVIDRPDKLCIITDIGFDHMHILGNTLSEIASQKAGIIQSHNQVIMYQQSAEIMQVMEARTKEQDASLLVVLNDTEKRSYQSRNWHLAYKAYQYLRKRDELAVLSKEIIVQTQQLQIPGRMDVRTIDNKTLVMDGAHNAQKMATFISSFQQRYPDAKPAVLLALKDDKQPVDIIPLIIDLAARIIITSFQTSQDLPVTALDPQQLAEQFRAAGAPDVTAIDDMSEAYRQLLDGPEQIVIVTGSFYLLSQLRQQESLR